MLIIAQDMATAAGSSANAQFCAIIHSHGYSRFQRPQFGLTSKSGTQFWRHTGWRKAADCGRAAGIDETHDDRKNARKHVLERSYGGESG
jgi:hypothetical protein